MMENQDKLIFQGQDLVKVALSKYKCLNTILKE